MFGRLLLVSLLLMAAAPVVALDANLREGCADSYDAERRPIGVRNVAEASASFDLWNVAQDGAALTEVRLEVPPGVTGGVATAAGRVVALAEADLWRQAAALAVATARRAPRDDGMRWLSIRIGTSKRGRISRDSSSGSALWTTPESRWPTSFTAPFWTRLRNRKPRRGGHTRLVWC